MFWRGLAPLNQGALTREAAVIELAGALLGVAIMGAVLAVAYTRYGWAR